MGSTSLSTRSSELELLICPASLVVATQRAPPSKIFEDTSIALQQSRCGPRQSPLLGIQRNYMQTSGPVPKGSVVNSLWDKIIDAVESSHRLPPSYILISQIWHLAPPPVKRLNSWRGASASHHHLPLCSTLCTKGGIQAH